MKDLHKYSYAAVMLIIIFASFVFTGCGNIKEASETYNILATHIGRVCRGKRKSCGGLQFKYDNIVPSPK